MTQRNPNNDHNQEVVDIFDFDGTIYGGDSFLDFAVMTRGRIRLIRALILSFPIIMAWKLGARSNHQAKQVLFRNLFKDMSYAEFRTAGEQFAERIQLKCNRAVAAELDAHKHLSVIASASLGDWIRPWALRHGVAHVFATEPDVRDGMLTGKFQTPNCYGVEKIRRIKEMIPNLSDFRIVVYTDSPDADASLLSIADEYHIIS